MKVTITFDADFTALSPMDGRPATPDEAKYLVECWLHDTAQTEIEAVDPNTGETIGMFEYVWTDRNVQVQVEGACQVRVEGG